MKKINTIKSNLDFSRIMHNNKSYKFDSFIIYLERKNNHELYKFGISVSKKLGNAVLRNKLKRQIKSIIDLNSYQNSFNCIIILRKEILTKNFNDKKFELNNIFSKLNILKEE